MPAQGGDVVESNPFAAGKPNTAEGQAAIAANEQQIASDQAAFNKWYATATPAQRYAAANSGNSGFWRPAEGGINGFLNQWVPTLTGALVTGGLAPEIGAAVGLGATASGAIGGGLWDAGKTTALGGSGSDIFKSGLAGAVQGAAPNVLKGVGGTIADFTGSELLGKTATGALGGGLGGLISGKGIGEGLASGAAGGAVGGIVGDVTGSSTLGSLGGKLAGSEVGSYLNSKGSGSAPGTTQGYGNVLSGTSRATTGDNSLSTPAQSTDLSQLPSGDSSLLGSLGNSLGSLGSSLGLGSLGSTLGSLATPTNLGYGAAAGLGLYEANQAKKDNQAYASTLTNLGQPYVDAGKQQLTAAQKGTLTPAQQAQVNNLQSQGNTLTSQANPLLSGGTTAINAANAGQLPAWQQAQIDQQVAQEKAQLRQSLGANVDSSTLAQYDAQIDQKAAISKGNLIQQNLQSGMNELNQGTTLEQQGQADVQQGYKTATDAVQQSFQNAMQLAASGNGPIMDAVNLMISGDTQISSALMGFMGNLAKAYASSGAGGGSKTTTPGLPTSGGGGGSPLSSLLGNLRANSGSPNLGGDQGANYAINSGAGDLLTDPLAGYDSNVYDSLKDEIGTEIPSLDLGVPPP